MSIRNPRTGRHEDDLEYEAYGNAGTVSVKSLVEHLEEIVGHRPTFGRTVADAATTAATIIREIAIAHPDVLDLDNAEVPLHPGDDK